MNGKTCFMNSPLAMRLKRICAVGLAALTAALLALAAVRVSRAVKEPMTLLLSADFTRHAEAEEENEDAKYREAVYAYDADDGNTYVMYAEFLPEDYYEALPEKDVRRGWVYSDGAAVLTFDHEAQEKELRREQRSWYTGREDRLFGAAMACLLAAVGLFVMVFFGKHFTNYEQLWFLSILVLAAIFSLLFPEEEANGVNGLIIMALYLADTFLNILCELLISKQSKWNFIVSVFVELTEIAICLVLMYRFATLASTLFFWLPCDIISFINWHKHPDRVEEELTQVRTLKGWQEALIITGIVVWTVGIGYFLTTLDLGSDFFKNRTVEVIVCYMDACATAVGIANGLFILFRFREQWIAWYIEAALEAAMNILAGQFVLLVLKVGYFTNTTYGYIKWTKYIRAHSEESPNTQSPVVSRQSSE